MNTCATAHILKYTGLAAKISPGSDPFLPPCAVSGLKFRERLQYLGVVGFVPGVVEDLAVTDDAVAVNHEHRPLGNSLQANHVLVKHAILADDVLVEVAQEGKRQPLRIMKSLERKERIDADAVHLRLRAVQARQLIPEGAQLGRAHGAE